MTIITNLTPNEHKVLLYMRNHNLTVREATLNLDLNGGTFTKIISDLIAKGYHIISWWENRINQHGEKKRFKVYSWSEE